MGIWIRIQKIDGNPYPNPYLDNFLTSYPNTYLNPIGFNYIYPNLCQIGYGYGRGRIKSDPFSALLDKDAITLVQLFQ